MESEPEGVRRTAEPDTGVADSEHELGPRTGVSNAVRAWASDATNEERALYLEVVRPEVELDAPPHFGEVWESDGVVVGRSIDGTPASESDELEILAEFQAALVRRIERRNAEASSTLDTVLSVPGLQTVWVHPPYAMIVATGVAIERLLASHEDMLTLLEFDDEQVEEDGVVSALGSIDITPTAQGLGQDGNGVGIWMNDGTGRPDQSNAAIDPADFTMIDSGGDGVQQHATQVAALAMASAPSARLYWAKGPSPCRIRTDVGTYGTPAVYVSSLSNDTYGDDSYVECSRDWDEYVYDTRVAHHQVAGNTSGCSGTAYVSSRGKAYNVITVGAYDDNASPESIASFSCWVDPETTASKPEVVAPGVSIAVAGFSSGNGTSFATPLAAGLTASLMESKTHLRLRPHLAKAYLMTGAKEMNTSNPALVKEKEGAGRVNFSGSHFNGHAVWWSGPASNYFTSDSDGDGKPDERVFEDLVAGRTYRVAISWLVRGTYVYTDLEPNFNFNLQVRNPSGTIVAGSASSRESFEMVEFTAATTGTYTVTIDRHWYNTTGDLALGYRLGW